MKKRLAAGALLLGAALGAEAQTKFGWALGDVAFFYDPLHNTANGAFSFVKLNWHFPYGFGCGLSLMEFHDNTLSDDGAFSYYAVLPAEVSYNLFSVRGQLYGALYLRGSWQIQSDGGAAVFPPDLSRPGRFYGGAGFRFFYFPTNLFRYSAYSSVFVEYSTARELKLGMSLDLGTVIYVALLAAAAEKWETVEERERF
ncbi:MAG: hypothetical protein LBR16_03715 [Treponema sp.]|jgi:hypothetical protein|nr:hypothetical protein [Treponema sp.]